MADSEYKVIDTRVMDVCINKKDSFISKYAEISSYYDEIIKKLKPNWKGEGADVFFDDAGKVRTNISGIADILSTMCSTLNDCREIFGDCDKSLGDFNRDPDQE